MEPSKLASLPFFQGISPEDVTKLLGELDAREVFYEKGPANGTEEQSLEKGEYYILADDPSSTEDSRSYGPILRKQIKGIVVTLIRRRNL